MNYKDKIISNPEIMLGKPIVRGTRITVEVILKCLSEDMSIDEILAAYPSLTKDDIMASLSYTTSVISQEELIEY